MNPRFTRRQFIGRAAFGTSLAATMPAFLAGTVGHLHAEADGKSTATPTGKDAPILVVVQLAGGNDGLNTVVPFANDHYIKARPRLGIAAKDVLKLNDEFGLHPALAGLKSLHDDGRLAVVHGVGYPNPNRSHFRSTEIWATASDADRVERHGWIGRYFDHACQGAEPTTGIAIGRQMPQAFAAAHPKGIALEDPEAYRFVEGAGERSEGTRSRGKGRGRVGGEPSMSDDPSMVIGDSGGSIGELAGGARMVGDPLDFLERTAMDAQVSSEQIRAISKRVSNTATYPNGRLGSALKLVARLIGGGLSTRIFYVSQGGYDTHTNQAGNHERLLRELGDSLKAFLADVKAQGNHERVLVMTFSEFGRRVSENASGGTDHGAGAPLFLAGARIHPGFHGTAPSLAPADLLNGDVRFQTDFRRVYATVLDGWLKTSSEKILGKRFEVMPEILKG